MATPGGMSDSYIGGIASSSLIPQDNDPFYITIQQPQVEQPKATDDVLSSVLLGGKSSAWNKDRNQTDEDKIVNLTCTDGEKRTNINKTDEYNVDYSGLSILPWEEFVFNPRVLNDLFYTESNQRITFDPDEVNVFFHGKNVMPPTVGDISENGKSWNIEVDSINNLRKVRQWLTEKCSVFGVTLQYKEKRFAKPVNVPCLAMIDPSKDSIGDLLYTTITRAMDTLHNQRRFCVEINLNGCIERWCRRVLLTDCQAIGAKLVITNGEEYANQNGTEDLVCCIFCFPIWLLQTGIYKLHRTVTYDDYMIDFAADDMFLHGTFQDAHCQRQHIFNDSANNEVFRTRNAQNTDRATLERLGVYKFVSVKKVKKTDTDEVVKERKTGKFEDLVEKRKEKVVKKDKKLLNKRPELQNTTSNVSVSQKEQITESNDSKKNQIETTKMTSHVEHVNKAYNGDEKDAGCKQETPRLPEISSFECTDENEKNVDIEIPSELKDDESIYSNLKTTDSVNGPINFRMEKKRNKSMTAVCSFENFDGDIESSSTDSEDEKGVRMVTERKENLLDEMFKIEKSLPAIVRENRPKDVDELKAVEAAKTEPEKEGKPKQNKIKVGKVLKDLMKTTEKHSDELPSAQDSKFMNSKNKLLKERSRKKAQDGKSTLYKKHGNQKSAERSNDDKGVTSNERSEKDKDEQDNDNLSILSSSDGDTVEMLYESQRSMTDVTSFDNGSDTEGQPNHIQGKPTPIDYVARANISGDIRDEDLDTVSELKGSKEISNKRHPTGGKSNDGFISDTGESQIEDLMSKGSNIIAVQRVQSFLAVTDMDDCDELGHETKKPNTNVSSLKLNMGDLHNKKAKRSLKKINSDRRYLGAAVPNKTKKRIT